MTRHAFVTLGALGLFLLALGRILARPDLPGPSDDTYIVFVYARRLVEQGALYYDAGAPPVDGFTSLLDVLLKAALYAVSGPDALFERSIMASILLTAAIPPTAWLLLLPHCQTNADRAAAWAACALVACHEIVGHLGWITLETPHFVLLGVVFVLALAGDRAREKPRVIFVASAALLWIVCRPEAMALVAIAFAVDAVAHRRPHPAAPFVAAGLAAFLAWRLATFGHWAPNTYYAKRSDDALRELRDGLAYLRVHLANPWVAVPWAAAGGTALLRGLTRPAGVLALAVAAILAKSGGDSYVEDQRFVALPVVLSLLTATLFYLRTELGATVRRRITAALIAAAVLAAAFVWRPPSSPTATVAARAAGYTLTERCDREVAEILATRYPGRRIGQTDFQSLKFARDELHVIDLYGLNDRDIAHGPFPGRNLWGKFDRTKGPAKDVDIWFVGYHFRRPRGADAFDPARTLADAELAADFFGDRYPVPEPWRTTMTLASAKPASCEVYYNFLVKKTLAL